jgi:hypothetical protein
MALVDIRKFQAMEPELGSEAAIRFKIQQGHLDRVIVRVGGRIYIDSEAWEEFKRTGGQKPTAPPPSAEAFA